jgi:hypothetical protein
MSDGNTRKKLCESGWVPVRVYISSNAKKKIIAYQQDNKLENLDLAIDKFIMNGGK